MTQTADPAMQAAMAAAGLIPGRSPEPARRPDPSRLFANRAARLRRLADGHLLADWLRFVALLADAQHQAVNGPAAAASASAPADWAVYLPVLAGALRGRLPVPAVAALDRLAALDRTDVAELGARIAAGAPEADDLAMGPFVAAAQQLAWTRFAAGLDVAGLTVSATAATCPVCGSPPVGGVIHVGSSGGLRYLHCGLCHTAWHRVRSACIACDESLGVDYRSIDGGDGGTRAEVCGSCGAYSKLFFLEKAPDMDPVADDLASLALDVLVSDEGRQRVGFNPFLLSAAG